jgi:hypothetical protein
MLARDLLQNLDPVAFAAGVGVTCDPKQAALLRSRSRYVVRVTSRQWGKSTTSALRAAWRLYYDPRAFVVIVSPTQRQSDETFAKLKTYLGAKIQAAHEQSVPRETHEVTYQRRPGAGRRVTAADVADEWNVRSLMLRSGARAVSLPGAPENIRGFSSVTDVIIDEAAFVDDALHAAVRPMLRVMRGSLWMMSTPNGQQGEFYRVCSASEDHWDRDTITVRDNPRIDPADVEIDRKELPRWLFEQEYECRFTERLGAVFAERDIQAALVEGEATWSL